MPAFSQNLTFVVNSSTTVILDYPNTGTTALTYFSNPAKGEGYYSGSDGIHTIQVQVSNFIGKIEIEGTLAVEPTTYDWFPVILGANNINVTGLGLGGITIDTTGLIMGVTNQTSISFTTATNAVRSLNFTGNYVWIRAKVSDFEQGTVGSIKYNF